jgi:hypothetical protein
MREIRPSGSEGGVADNGHPYPYLQSLPEIGQWVVRPALFSRNASGVGTDLRAVRHGRRGVSADIAAPQAVGPNP